MSVTVVPYNPAWPARFDQERRLLERVLAPWLDDGIHHIGSTSIPGLAAKPIVDMMAGVRDLDEARAASAVLLHEGTCTPAPCRDRPPLRQAGGEITTHGLHLTEPGSELWRERLAFRDASGGGETLAREYEAFKLTLAEQHNVGLVEYTPGKRAFVARVLEAEGIGPDASDKQCERRRAGSSSVQECGNALERDCKVLAGVGIGDPHVPLAELAERAAGEHCDAGLVEKPLGDRRGRRSPCPRRSGRRRTLPPARRR